MFDKFPRTAIRNLPPIAPGLPFDELKIKYGLDEIVRLGNNENFWGVSPKAAAAMRKEIDGSNFYPDHSCLALRQALAQRHEVSPDMITVSAGGSNILFMIALAFIEPGDEVVMAAPTFPVYRRNTLLMGGKPVEIPLKDHFHDLEAMAAAVNERTRLVVVCNPNNPTGTLVDGSALSTFIDDLPDSVLVLVDDVYIDFVAERDRFDILKKIRSRRPVLAIRSFSKVYGLAGIRVGYALGCSELIYHLNRVRGGFPVSGPGQAAALASLEDDEFLIHVTGNTARARAALTGALEELGLNCPRSHTNFVFVDFGLNAGVVAEALLSRGFAIAAVGPPDSSTFGRVTVATPEINQKFVAALEQVLDSPG